MDAQGLVKRLDSDGIDHLQVIYHDYSGRAGAKTVAKESFASAVEHGVVFARRRGWLCGFRKPAAGKRDAARRNSNCCGWNSARS